MARTAPSLEKPLGSQSISLGGSGLLVSTWTALHLVTPLKDTTRLYQGKDHERGNGNVKPGLRALARIAPFLLHGLGQLLIATPAGVTIFGIIGSAVRAVHFLSLLLGPHRATLRLDLPRLYHTAPGMSIHDVSSPWVLHAEDTRAILSVGCLASQSVHATILWFPRTSDSELIVGPAEANPPAIDP